MEQVTKKVDRLAVRALAEQNSAALLDFAKSGGNVYQKSLEQQDAINEIAAEMDEADAAEFLNTYAEELNACSMKTLDDVQVAHQEAEATGQIIGWVIAFVVFIVFLSIIF